MEMQVELSDLYPDKVPPQIKVDADPEYQAAYTRVRAAVRAGELPDQSDIGIVDARQAENDAKMGDIAEKLREAIEQFHAALGADDEFYNQHSDVLQPLTTEDGMRAFAAEVTPAHIARLYREADTLDSSEAEAAREEYAALDIEGRADFLGNLLLREVYLLWEISRPEVGISVDVYGKIDFLSIPTGGEHSHALQPYNSDAGEGVGFWDRKTGNINPVDSGTSIKFLQMLLYVMRNKGAKAPEYIALENEWIAINIGGLLQSQGIEPRGMATVDENGTRQHTETAADARMRYARALVNQIEGVYGKLHGDPILYEAAHIRYDQEKGVLYIQSDYLEKYLNCEEGNYRKKMAEYDAKVIELKDRKKSARTASKYYPDPYISELVRATIQGERNPRAVQMTEYVVRELQRHGTQAEKSRTGNKKRDYSSYKKYGNVSSIVIKRIAVSDLIKGCPLLGEKLNTIMAEAGHDHRTGRKRAGQQLTRDMKRMYELLKEKTEICRYYAGLKIISAPLSTMTTKDADIIEIIHFGINAKWSAPQIEAPKKMTISPTEIATGTDDVSH